MTATEHRRITILRYLATQHGPVTRAAIAAATGIEQHETNTTLRDLGSRGHTERMGRSRDGMTRATAAGLAWLDRAPRSEVKVRLPLHECHMRDGFGERRDCGRYDDCLSGFIEKSRGRGGVVEGNAHCASDCEHWTPPERVRATEYAASGYSNYDAAIYAGGAG